MKMLKPGVHWPAVHLLCHRILIRGFLRLGIFRSPLKEGDSTQSHNGASNPNGVALSDNTGMTQIELEDAILASGISGAFFPHGLGHSLGMDVHDVPSASKPLTQKTSATGAARGAANTITHTEGGADARHEGPEKLYEYLRLTLPLEESMVVTVEPGVYFSPHLVKPFLAPTPSPFLDPETLKKYEGMGGVRIEDVVLITADGYENLTTVRGERSWVEGVCSGEL